MHQYQKIHTGAIDTTWTPERPFNTPNPSLVAVLVHFSAAPTTAENFVISYVTENGDEFETVIYSVDPSSGSSTNIVLSQSTIDIPLTEGESIKVTYLNTDGLTIGITLKAKYVR